MKTTFDYDHYYDYEEIKAHIEYFEEHYPNIISSEVICVTEEGRNVYAVTITNKQTGDPLSKPAFHTDGNHHAGEVTGSMATMHMMDYLVTNYGIDEEVTEIVDTMTFYFVPRVSPDGSEHWLKNPTWVLSAPRPNNVEKGGIQEADLDGDGIVRMMRIQTPYGKWKIDPKDPSTMCPREPGDRKGTFYDLYPEGYHEPFDGDENLKTKKFEWSLNFNRNYPYGWFPETRQPGAGKYPLSNLENKALADWIIEHPNIGGVTTNHTSGGVILYPPGTKPEAKANQQDIAVFKAIAKMGQEELGYEPLNIYDSFISDPENYDSGAFDDWCYQTQGILAYTIEYWDLAKKVGYPYDYHNHRSDTLEVITKRFNAELNWVKENGEPGDYLPWTPYEHPTFGTVEIGGFNYKYNVQNPPAKFLLEIMEGSTKFFIKFAKSMPCLVIDSIQSEALSEDVYKITAVIGNTGYLPTYISEEAVKLKISKPVEVTLSGGEVVSGKPTELIDSLSGYSRTPTGDWNHGGLTTPYAAPAKKKLTWVIKANAGDTITIKASQIKSGIAEQSIQL